MKKLIFISIIVGALFIGTPSVEAAKKKALFRTCTYSDGAVEAKLLVREDSEYDLTITKHPTNDGIPNDEPIDNWKQVSGDISAKGCPSYLVVAHKAAIFGETGWTSSYEENAYYIKSDAESKAGKYKGKWSAKVVPLKSDKPEKVAYYNCTYNFKGSTGVNYKYTYTIYKDDYVSLPFSGVISNESGTWGQYGGLGTSGKEAAFKKQFVSETKNSKTCPTLTVKQSEATYGIFVGSYTGSECETLSSGLGGFCTPYTANSGSGLTEDATNDGEKVEPFKECTYTGDAIGYFNSSKSFKPTFRIFESGKKFWYIGNASEGRYLDDQITLNDSLGAQEDGWKMKIFLDQDARDAIFDDEKKDVKCDVKLYRLVNHTGATEPDYALHLTTKYDESQDIWGKADDQLEGSNHGVPDEDLLEEGKTQNPKGVCEILSKDGELFKLLKEIIGYVQIGTVFLVLILGMMDLAGAVGSSEEGAFKKAGGKFSKRLIAGVLVFLVPAIVNIILSIVNLTACGTPSVFR